MKKNYRNFFYFGFVFLTLMCNFQTGSAQTTKEIVLKTNISEVTVFLKGAQIDRNVSTNVSQGKSTIKFANLSPYVDPKSVQVRIDNNNITVLSVNHQVNFMDSIKLSKETQALKQQLENTEDKLKLEITKQEVINEELNFLKENIKIGGSNEGVTLTKLRETSAFYSQQVNSLKTKKIEVDKNISKLNKTLEELKNELAQQGASKKEPMSEVLVAIDAKTATNCTVELSYYVENASWYPTYDIRSISISDPIKLTYKANIQQNTKEDWKNVKLKVSSLNPNLGNTPPQLKTYFLDYYTAPPRYETSFNKQIQGRVVDSQNEAIIGATIRVVGSTIGASTNIDGIFNLAKPANATMLEVSFVGMVTQTVPISTSFMNIMLQDDVQMLEEVVVTGYSGKRSLTGALAGKVAGVATLDKSKKSAPLPVMQTENQTAVEFEIKMPYTVLSDNKSITVDMETYELSAQYEHFSIPKADKDAFLLAYVRDWEKYNLLEGDANIFYENSFVGKTILDTRTMSDTLNISLGRDKNVQIKREKVKEFSTKKFLASKKEETRVWKTTVRNNKKQAVKLLLFDQIPVSTNKDIEVNADNLSGGTLNKENGEVKWIFNLAPGDRKEVELKYTVKYPKDRQLNIE
ncbi:MAG: mucoidy inhibitor MuiA family protein [Porphyromonadaceae bacterium]|nr:mucoidy inhibitor MuiA family protein [Porphyromonadaceae bacterium]